MLAAAASREVLGTGGPAEALGGEADLRRAARAEARIACFALRRESWVRRAWSDMAGAKEQSITEPSRAVEVYKGRSWGTYPERTLVRRTVIEIVIR